MNDHQGCAVTLTEFHDCPPCPHGLLRGFEFVLTGNEVLDARTREMHLRRIARMSCSDRGHAELLAAREATPVGDSPSGHEKGR